MSMNINSKNQHAVSTLPSVGTLGQIVYLISDNSFYGRDANSSVWKKLTNDAGGAIDLSGYQTKSEEYIISELGYETGLPLHIQLINEIKSYERMIVQPLYDAIQALSALTQDQKNIVNAVLFG